MDLNTIWFLLVGVLLTVYAVTEGFDLGAGIIHIFSKSERERKTLINAISPVWDENEVWLITGGGALFAAFPHVYATVFSAFYVAVMLLLLAIIFRAVSIEVRGKSDNPKWRQRWDFAFSISSFLIALLLGAALGNVIHGIPIAQNMEARISFIELLNPYSVLFALMVISAFTMHGSIFAYIKSPQEINESFRNKAKIMTWVTLGLFLVVAAYSLAIPHLAQSINKMPASFIVGTIGVIAFLLLVARSLKKGLEKKSFIASTSAISMAMILVMLILFPNIVYSTLNSLYNLDIYNSASSQKTLSNMLIIACIGMPLVIAYTVIVYRVFRGKVRIEKDSGY